MYYSEHAGLHHYKVQNHSPGFTYCVETGVLETFNAVFDSAAVYLGGRKDFVRARLLDIGELKSHKAVCTHSQRGAVRPCLRKHRGLAMVWWINVGNLTRSRPWDHRIHARASERPQSLWQYASHAQYCYRIIMRGTLVCILSCDVMDESSVRDDSPADTEHNNIVVELPCLDIPLHFWPFKFGAQQEHGTQRTVYTTNTGIEINRLTTSNAVDCSTKVKYHGGFSVLLSDVIT